MFCRPSLQRVTWVAWFLVCGVVVVESRQDAPSDEPTGPRLVLVAGAFAGEPDLYAGARTPRVRGDVQTLTAVTADLEGDGDLDLLVNRHLDGLELFVNTDGRMQWVDAELAGLCENEGLPHLRAPRGFAEHLHEAPGPGIWVWSSSERRGDWRVLVRGGVRQLTLAANEAFQVRGDDEIVTFAKGLGTGAMRRLVLPGSVVDGRLVELHVQSVGVQFVVKQMPEPDAEPLPFFVGADAREVRGVQLELWTGDPHGLAWLDVVGSPDPDLFVTRGALQGALTPETCDPKPDRLYELDPATASFRQSDDVPRNFSRGRALEWVDVDADGASELFLANRDSPDVLLARVDGAWIDRAPELGLDLTEGEVAAWFDVDEDGDDDLVALEDDAFVLLLNPGGRGPFERLAGSDVGLVLPAAQRPQHLARASSRDTLFDPRQLFVTDFDRDGRLDLLVTGNGSRVTALRGIARGKFEDATSAWNLAEIECARGAALIDADDDGLEDLVLYGPGFALLRRGPEGFELERSDVPDRVRTAVVGDFDGDGREDVVAIGVAPHLLRNTGGGANRALLVRLESPGSPESPATSGRPPIGAVVTATYASGARRAQRFGSARNPYLSQTLGPLRFGVPAGDEIVELAVRWPGRAHAESVPVPAAAAVWTLTRE